MELEMAIHKAGVIFPHFEKKKEMAIHLIFVASFSFLSAFEDGRSIAWAHGLEFQPLELFHG
jgi:hypothetical protein